MAYKLQWQDRVVVFEYSGIVSSSDILESNQIVHGDRRFDNLKWQLVFFENVDEVHYTERDVKQIAYCDIGAYKSNPDIQVLFVGGSNLVEELFATFEKYVGEDFWPIIHVENREEAWCCLEELAGQVYDR